MSKLKYPRNTSTSSLRVAELLSSLYRALVGGLAQEVLLARVAEEVGVGVAVAHVGERVRADEPLVARLDVDRRVAGALAGCSTGGRRRRRRRGRS